MESAPKQVPCVCKKKKLPRGKPAPRVIICRENYKFKTYVCPSVRAEETLGGKYSRHIFLCYVLSVGATFLALTSIVYFMTYLAYHIYFPTIYNLVAKSVIVFTGTVLGGYAFLFTYMAFSIAHNPCGANNRVIFLHSIILFWSFVYLLVLTVFLIGSIQHITENGLLESIKASHHQTSPTFKNWQATQAHFKCCGVHKYTDWYKVLGTQKDDTLPTGCCQEWIKLPKYSDWKLSMMTASDSTAFTLRYSFETWDYNQVYEGTKNYQLPWVLALRKNCTVVHNDSNTYAIGCIDVIYAPMHKMFSLANEALLFILFILILYLLFKFVRPRFGEAKKKPPPVPLPTNVMLATTRPPG